MKMRMHFSGGEQLARTLAKLPQRTSRRVQLEALKDAAEPMARTASDLAPRRPGAPDLADNIIVMGARGADTGGLPAATYGPTRAFFYGYFQEFGTKFHAPNAFMRPSFDRGVSGALRSVSASLWRALISRGFGSARVGQGSTETFAAPKAPRVVGGAGGGLL